ncbi:MAG: ATP-binding protein [Xanthobacteraceae bacterium]
MPRPLNVLIVEDSENDSALLLRELRRGGYELSFERVDDAPAMRSALARCAWDIVLTDYSMPQFNAKAALAVVANSGVDVPCIVVSGSVGEETAVEVMRAGAQDLILKHNLKRLLPAIARELAAAQSRRERRLADYELDRERELLRQLMNGIPDAICFKDLERRYIRLNDAERSILNVCNGAEAIGKRIDELVAAEFADKRRREEEQVVATGKALIDCIEKHSDSSGAERWISSTKAPIRDSRGDIVGIVEVARDITETRRQQQLKDEFIATVSHELRTPLTSILGAVGCLIGGATGELPAAAARMLMVAMNNCRRLVGIVNDILDMETIEAGKMRYDKRPLDAHALAVQVIEANQSFAANYGVALRLDGAAARREVFSVFADSDRLSQVLTNLISNAIKFSPRDTEVSMSIENDNETIGISVRDHGPGIPDDYKDRIFEKFVQVDATDRRRRGGTGLGLSIVKRIVEQMDGTIGFAPAPGGGTIFTVAFRAWTPRPSAGASGMERPCAEDHAQACGELISSKG